MSQEQLNAARETMAARRAAGNFTSPDAVIELKPLAVKLLSIDQDANQVMVEYPGGVREVLSVAEIATVTVLAPPEPPVEQGIEP